MGYFDERRVTQADVYGISYAGGEDGGFSLTVGLGVSNLNGNDLGPVATIQLFLPREGDVSLSALQEEAVDRALDLMKRILAEDREAVKRLLYAPPGIDLEKR